jgi:hypothetical protein
VSQYLSALERFELCLLANQHKHFFFVLHYHLFLILTPVPIHKIIGDSQSKDKFLRVSLKRLTDAQNFEDELKQVNALNETLLARNQKLETQ